MSDRERRPYIVVDQDGVTRRRFSSKQQADESARRLNAIANEIYGREHFTSTKRTI